MRWSKLKARVESFFARGILGRVELRSVRYRESLDRAGRGILVVDGEEVWASGSGVAETITGSYSQRDFYHALEEYCNLSIDEVFASSDLLILALAILDRRVGKRRLELLREQYQKHPLLERLYKLRYDVERMA